MTKKKLQKNEIQVKRSCASCRAVKSFTLWNAPLCRHKTLINYIINDFTLIEIFHKMALMMMGNQIHPARPQSSFYDMSAFSNAEYINFKTYHSTQSPNDSNLIYRPESLSLSIVRYKLNRIKWRIFTNILIFEWLFPSAVHYRNDFLLSRNSCDFGIVEHAVCIKILAC